MHFSRRRFLGSAAMVTAAFGGLRHFVEGTARAEDADKKEPLQEDFYGTIDLPKNFTYTIFSETGEHMDDGLLVPGKHDGMGAFPGPTGTTILIRNHEVEVAQNEVSPFGPKRNLLRRVNPNLLYDRGKGKKPGLGGTTTLIYDTKRNQLVRHYLSLAGTHRNCAGGVTPWGTWVTCEETVDVAEGDIEKDHGYNFEVPPRVDVGLVKPVALTAMGRFRHEAIAVDPKSGAVYQTEDRSDGLLYRFVPNTPGELAAGGKLQALRIRDQNGADTRNWRDNKFKIGQKFSVEWVEIHDVESYDDDLRYQGRYENGAARFARGEGIWYGHQSLYFACTNGGKKKKGQIWRYIPSPVETQTGEDRQPGTLELFVEPNDTNLVENADNLTIAPWGDLIVCEDGTSPQYLVGVTPKGEFYRIGKTSLGELAGACFSPDGSTLFVNIQNPGLTLAIQGPWQELRHPSRLKKAKST
jgi:hypothetical protein